MIISYKYTSDHDISFANEIDFKNKKILDIGSAMIANNSIKNFSCDNINYATVDLFPIKDSKLHFQGNISHFALWAQIKNHTEKYGKFDFAFVSHTLEDITNPFLVCNMLGDIAHEGIISCPSKYMECVKHKFGFRGFMHHRWIFNIENNRLVGYPKLNFIDHVNFFDEISNLYTPSNAELQIFWKNDINLQIVNNDFLGPTELDTLENYKNLLNN